MRASLAESTGRAAFVAAAAFASLLLPVRTAAACECQSPPPCEALSNADLIFTGTVTDIRPETAADGQSVKATLTTIVADHAFVGQTGTFVVRDVLSTCAFRFRVNQRYLVYATRMPDGGLAVSICSRTKELGQAGEDLNYLTTLPPPGGGGRVRGMVERLDIDLLGVREGENLKRPAAGVSVALTDPNGERFTLVSDAGGRLEAAGLQAGRYTVSLDQPPSTKVQLAPAAIRLADRGCASLHATLISNGRIRGRVLDRGGDAVAGAFVTLMPAAFTSRDDFPRAWIRNTGSTDDGGFVFDGLPPGEYHVGVNVDGPRMDIPYAPSWFPGVPARARTTAVSLAEGQARSGVDIVVADRLRPVPITGVVHLPDGTPAADVDVRLQRAGTPLQISATRTRADGTFELTALPGFPFSVVAWLQPSHRERWTARATVEPGDEPMRDLRLVLARVR